jgi:hypothetical protein
MKKTRDLTFVAALFAISLFVTAYSAFGQNTSTDDCTATYKVLVDNRMAPELTKLRLAFSSGRDYLTKCSEEKDQEAMKTFVAGQMPKIDARIKAAEKAAEIKAIETRYENAANRKKYDEMLAAGKELLKLDRPYSLDLMLDVATMGYNNASAKPAVDKYNEDALAFAKQALEKISEGKISGFDNKYGYYSPYTTKNCADGKTNAVGWMNYLIGYITYKNLKRQNDALPYLYKASQLGCETKETSEPYQFIGDSYVDELLKLEQSRAEKLKAAGEKDTDETRAVYAMQKGYAERSLDAYARAYRAALSSNRSQSYKDILLQKVRDLYGIRYDDDLSKFDAYMANVGTTVFVDPATPVRPVKDAVPPPAEAKIDAKPKAAPKAEAVKARSRKQVRKAH